MLILVPVVFYGSMRSVNPRYYRFLRGAGYNVITISMYEALIDVHYTMSQNKPRDPSSNVISGGNTSNVTAGNITSPVFP